MKEITVIPDIKKTNSPYYSKTIENNEDINIIELIKSNHLVVEKVDNNIILYLPQTISFEQFQYLLLKKEEFKNYEQNIRIYSVEKEKYLENTIDSLYEEIKTKAQTKKNIVIIPNEEELEIPNGIYYDSFSVTERHAEKLDVFCKQYNIGITVEEDTIGHEVSLQLANFGHFAINGEEKNIVFYIPNQVSNNQLEWFKKNLLLIKEFKVQGYVFENRKVESISYKKDNPLKSIEEILFKLEEKLIIKTKNSITR